MRSPFDPSGKQKVAKVTSKAREDVGILIRHLCISCGNVNCYNSCSESWQYLKMKVCALLEIRIEVALGGYPRGMRQAPPGLAMFWGFVLFLKYS